MTDTIDRLRHNYDGIDLDIVWETATINIPTLLPVIQAILDAES